MDCVRFETPYGVDEPGEPEKDLGWQVPARLDPGVEKARGRGANRLRVASQRRDGSRHRMNARTTREHAPVQWRAVQWIRASWKAESSLGGGYPRQRLIGGALMSGAFGVPRHACEKQRDSGGSASD